MSTSYIACLSYRYDLCFLHYVENNFVESVCCAILLKLEIIKVVKYWTV